MNVKIIRSIWLTPEMAKLIDQFRIEKKLKTTSEAMKTLLISGLDNEGYKTDVLILDKRSIRHTQERQKEYHGKK